MQNTAAPELDFYKQQQSSSPTEADERATQATTVGTERKKGYGSSRQGKALQEDYFSKDDAEEKGSKETRNVIIEEIDLDKEDEDDEGEQSGDNNKKRRSPAMNIRKIEIADYSI